MLRGIKTLCSIRSARIYRKSRKTKLKALKIRYFTEQIFLEDEIKADLNDEEQFEDFSKTIVDLCLQKKTDFRETPLFYKLKYCPTCPPHNDKNSNLYKLIIWKSSGGFYCHRCNNKGGYMKFRAMMDREPTYTKITRNLLEDEKKKKFAMKSKSEELRPKMLQILEKARLSEKNKNFFEQILEKRGITKETLKKFNSGVIHWSFYTDDGFKRKPAIVFPWYVTNTNYSTKVLQRIKLRGLEEKSDQIIYPSGGSWGFFGLNTIKEKDKSIVITEGEYDAMAVYQATKMTAISLPVGCNALPVDLLPLLDQFEKIYLWTDNDLKGKEAAEKFSRKLGIERCYWVDPGTKYKDANDVLLSGENMKKIILGAKIIPHKQVSSFADIKKDVYYEFKNFEQQRGAQFNTIPCLNGLMKGHRDGELTILTGQTGIGKTTFLSQISLDLAQQGVSTLWGSFEIKNARLVKIMMNQHSGVNIENDIENFENHSKEFEKLPLNFLKFFGSTDLVQLIDAIEYATFVYDVRHIVLDNLQFMIGHSNNMNKLEQQDWAISTLRHFATKKNIHITVVIHPRKEDDNKKIGISSIFGSAKATQEADNVLILSNEGGKKLVQLKKNRFTGDIGSVEVNFDKDNKMFFSEETPLNYGRPMGVKDAYKKFIEESRIPIEEDSEKAEVKEDLLFGDESVVQTKRTRKSKSEKKNLGKETGNNENIISRLIIEDQKTEEVEKEEILGNSDEAIKDSGTKKEEKKKRRTAGKGRKKTKEKAI